MPTGMGVWGPEKTNLGGIPGSYGSPDWYAQRDAAARHNRQMELLKTAMGGGGSSSSSFGAGGQLQQFADNINPTMGANRFESGLQGYENRLTGLLDDPSKIKETAAYKFRTQQGEQALNRQMAAKGMLGSGNRLMDLMKYGQDMASQEYDTQLGRLQGLVGTYGQNWNQAQGTNVNQYLGEMGHKRNALSDMLTGELKSMEINKSTGLEALKAMKGLGWG